MSSLPTVPEPTISYVDVPCCRFAHLHPDLARGERRYPSDMSDAEWVLVEPVLPVPASVGYWGGGRELYCRCVIVEAIRYLVDNGCKRLALPCDFPAWGCGLPVFSRFERAEAGVRLVDVLRQRLRVVVGRDGESAAAVIDFQSVRAVTTVPRRHQRV